MQKVVFFLLLIISGIKAFSQQEFFVYFQADNYQPIYVRINTQIYSSTETGYIIIPKLSDSVYEIVIGFAKNAFPEQSFPITINRRDRGFQLKNLGEKGWALINLQNMAVTNNTGLPSKPLLEFSGTKKTDAFSELLANVVNDSAILYAAVAPKPVEPIPVKTVPVAKEPEPKESEQEVVTTTTTVSQPANKEPLKNQDSLLKLTTSNNELTGNLKPKKDSVVKSDSQSLVKNQPAATIITPAVKDERLTEKPFITRLEEKNTKDLYEATYMEQYNFATDTINIRIVLNEEAITKALPANAPVEEKIVQQPESISVTEEKTVPLKPVTVDSTESKNRTIQIINSDCKDFATEYEVDKLRVKLISDKTIDEKLGSIKKFLKNRCLTVKQVKALTELFPSDETKYRFFDTAYPYVSDTSNFYMLQELIENDYYKNRFRAMILK